METIQGQKIERFQTMDTIYSAGTIGLYDDEKNFYKMKVEEILKFDKPFNELVFNIVQKRKYKYIELGTN